MTEQPKLEVDAATEKFLKDRLVKLNTPTVQKRLKFAGICTLVAAVGVTGFVLGAKGMDMAYKNAFQQALAEEAKRQLIAMCETPN